MRPTGERWWLRNATELQLFTEAVKGRWAGNQKVCVQFIEEPRTLDQNQMFYALYRDIANQREDMSIVQVRADCKLRYGVVIRKAADPDWATHYDQAIKPLSMELKLFIMQEYPVTRGFTKKQASEYIDSIIEDYTRHGYALADPRHNS